MFAGLDVIAAVGGLIVPPAFDFIKKKFLKPKEDTAEATISTLATTKPEAIPQFIESRVKWMDAGIRWFNRDVVGQPSQWVVDIRAAIRPIVTILCIIALVANGFEFFDLPADGRAGMLSVVTSWFGDRMVKS